MNAKQILIVINILLAFNHGFCQKMQQIGSEPVQWYKEELNSRRPGSRALIIDTIYNQMIVDKSGINIIPEASRNVYIRKSALVIGFVKNQQDNPEQDLAYNRTFVKVKIEYKKNGSSVLHRDSVRLSLDYNRDKGKNYKAKDYFELEDVMWAKLSLDSFDCSIPSASLTDLFMLRANLMGQEDFVIRDKTLKPTALNIAVENSGINFKWEKVIWANSYDLEWRFLDPKLVNDPGWKNNSTRVNISDIHYNIPLISTHAKLLWRVRAKGINRDSTVFNGAWVSGPNYLIDGEIVFEKDKKNWSYQASYAENGLRKDMVNVADGSSRVRQSMTHLNTEGNPLLIAETYYDYQGRPVVQSLPTPYLKESPESAVVIGSNKAKTGPSTSLTGSIIDSRFLPLGYSNTNSSSRAIETPNLGKNSFTSLYSYLKKKPSMEYIPSFNLDMENNAYDRKSFDLDQDECNPNFQASPMSTASGSGKYYSPENGFNHIHSAYIPDAEKYPFVQVEYTPDNTGRIRRQGNAGKDFQLGSNHEIKFYYSTPSQQELTRMFGNEVGDASKYSKVIKEDENGQLHISYMNSKGQTIATALAGEKPNSLENIEKEENMDLNTDYISQGNFVDYKVGLSEASPFIFIENNNTPFKIRYSLNDVNFEPDLLCFPRQNICYDCPKELNIRLTNSCGQIVFEKNKSIGPLNDISLIYCESSDPILIDTTILLPKGEYIISKSLRLISSEREKYILDYVKRDTACFNPAIPIPPPCTIVEECIPCKYKYIPENGYLIRDIGNNSNCRRDCKDSFPNYDVTIYETLLRDMSPRGQYAGIISDSTLQYKVSIFNPENILFDSPKSFLTPAFPYRNADGTMALIDVTDLSMTYYMLDSVVSGPIRGHLYVRPQHITNFDYLISIWQESWTESLVPYHPEFFYLKWNSENLVSSINHDKHLGLIQKYDDALTTGFMNTTETLDLTLVNSDPYFISKSIEVKNNFLDKLKKAVPLPDGSYLDIYQSVRMSAFCNAPLYSSSPALMRSCVNDANHAIVKLDEEGKNFALQTFKANYQNSKQKIIDSSRTADLKRILGSTSSRLNHCITRDNCPPCESDRSTLLMTILREKKRRVFHPACINERYVPIISDSLPSFSSVQEAAIYAKLKNIYNCGLPTSSHDFLALLNALVMDFGKSKNKFCGTNINLNSTPPLVIGESLIKNFPNKLSSKYIWNAVSKSKNQLELTIHDDRGTQQSLFVLEKSDGESDWCDIIYFSCLDVSEDNKASMFAFVKDTHRMTIRTWFDRNSNFNFSPSAARAEQAELEASWRRLTQKKNFPPFKGPKYCHCIQRLLPQASPENDCEREVRVLHQSNIIAAKLERARLMYDSMMLVYTAHCIGNGNEEFSSTVKSQLYHFTLFYYDQAGNLTKTVPPKAVRLLNETDGSEYPNHIEALSTIYRYNSLNQKLYRRTPDGGITKWCYDHLGRVILSQDALQLANNERNYILYDSRGRTTQSGVVGGASGFNEMIEKGNVNFYNEFMPKMRSRDPKFYVKEVNRIVYDKAIDDLIISTQFSKKQSFMRNRISSVQYTEGRTIPFEMEGTVFGESSRRLSPYTHASYYNYDIAGNMTELIHDFKNLQAASGINETLATAHRFKKINYRFDLLTGNVKEIAYQANKPDQMYHWYEYDADNRLKAVQTGFSIFEPEDARDKDAKYEFYLHGPAARVSLGQENIQGIDLAYTINGWLKNVNNPNGVDIGNDGVTNNILKDALSYELKYYNGDYKAIKATDLGSSTPLAANASLYNSNLAAIKMHNNGFGQDDVHTHQYKYDQLNRLVSSRVDGTENFAMNLSYDKNGNIATLSRKDGRGILFDHLTYHYNNLEDNKLKYIDDRANPLSGQVKDLLHQSDGNYRYDIKGRLTEDHSDGEDKNMEWLSSDKLKKFTSPDGTSTFYYDALGRRVYKNTFSGTGEYTVRDFAGNIMAEYAVMDGKINLKSFPIYASSRIGAISMDTVLTSSNLSNRKLWTQYRGQKLYELKNQIGDINALVSDRRVPSESEFIADVRKATDYYPFGMIMPGRDSSSIDYRYGFQGMEQDNNLKGEGNSYTTEFRQYDPRVGRWMSVDLWEEKYPNFSPYTGMFNNPIIIQDPLGLGDEDDDHEGVGNEEQLEAATVTVAEASGEVMTATIALEGAQRAEHMRVGQRIQIMRYDLRQGVNRTYTVLAGSPNPIGTTDPQQGRPGYSRDNLSLISRNKANTHLYNQLRELATAQLNLARALTDLALITANDIQMPEHVQNRLTNFSRVLQAVNILSTMQGHLDAYANLTDGIANLQSRNPEDLEGRIDDFSRIFDNSIHFLEAIGIPIPPYLSDGFVRSYGRAIFRHAFEANRIIEQERGENCYGPGNHYSRFGDRYRCVRD